MRNKTSNRLEHKLTKRDTASSEEEMVHSNKIYRLNSYENEIQAENYLRLKNSSVSPERAAVMIKEHFGL